VDLQQQVKEGKYKSYVEAFGKFEVLEPSTETVPAGEYFAERLDEVYRVVRRLERQSIDSSASVFRMGRSGGAHKLPKARYRIQGSLSDTAAREVLALRGVHSLEAEPQGEFTIVTVELDPLGPSATEQQVATSLASHTGAVVSMIRAG
jgi:hypothetical protein